MGIKKGGRCDLLTVWIPMFIGVKVF